jgi:hypothetical protein
MLLWKACRVEWIEYWDTTKDTPKPPRSANSSNTSKESFRLLDIGRHRRAAVVFSISALSFWPLGDDGCFAWSAMSH